MATEEKEESSFKNDKEEILRLKGIIATMAIIIIAIVLLCGYFYYKFSGGGISNPGELLELTNKYNALSVESQALQDKLAEKEAELAEQERKLSEESKRVDDANNENEKIIADLEDALEASGELYEELYAEGPDRAILSEAYYFSKTKWNILDNYTLNDSGSVVSTGFMRVNPKYYYCAYLPGGEVTITSYSEDYAVLESVKGDASAGYFAKFNDASYYIKVSFSSAYKNSAILVSTGIDKNTLSTPRSGRAFYVVSKNSPVSLSPSLAVSKVLSGGTVLILPGVYTDQISAMSKSVNLLGVGSGSCVIQSFSCDYLTPPLEIAAGTVSNLSFKAINSNSTITELKAYGIHIDYDYSFGRNLTISNCVITSDFNAGIGIGLRGGGTLRISNCAISGADRGIFVHDSDREAVGGTQNLVIESCNITAVGARPAIHLHSQGKSNANVSLAFTNNTLTSTGGAALVSCSNQNEGVFEGTWNNLQNYHLVSGYGNNAAELNQ